MPPDAQPQPLHATLWCRPARGDRRARRWTSQRARAAGLDETTIAEVEVAATEVLSNVIIHSYDEQPGASLPLLTLDIDHERLTLGILDHGRPFDPAAYRPPNSSTSPARAATASTSSSSLMDSSRASRLRRRGHVVSLARFPHRPTRGTTMKDVCLVLEGTIPASPAGLGVRSRPADAGAGATCRSRSPT